MLKKIKLILLTLTLLILHSCYDAECKKTNEWQVENYSIIEKKCKDGVTGFFKTYYLFEGEKKVTHLSRLYEIDTCEFGWQVDKKKFVKFNVCKNLITDIQSKKQRLERATVDSIKLVKEVSREEKILRPDLVDQFVRDWNNCDTRDYNSRPFDKAFEYYYPYQYKILVYSSGEVTQFYGYNFVILDQTNWKSEMGPNGYIDYFNDYWNK